MGQGAMGEELIAKRRRRDWEIERPCEIASHHFVNFTGQAGRLGDVAKERKGERKVK